MNIKVINVTKLCFCAPEMPLMSLYRNVILLLGRGGVERGTIEKSLLIRRPLFTLCCRVSCISLLLFDYYAYPSLFTDSSIGPHATQPAVSLMITALLLIFYLFKVYFVFICGFHGIALESDLQSWVYLLNILLLIAVDHINPASFSLTSRKHFATKQSLTDN